MTLTTSALDSIIQHLSVEVIDPDANAKICDKRGRSEKGNRQRAQSDAGQEMVEKKQPR